MLNKKLLVGLRDSYRTCTVNHIAVVDSMGTALNQPVTAKYNISGLHL